MKIKKQSLILIVIIFCSVYVKAQQTISGVITDEQQKPLSGVVINVDETDFKTFSNSDGTYKIIVPDKATALSFVLKNYLTKSLKIDNEQINIVLSSDVNVLFDLTIEELLEIKVYSASKTKEKISDAPGFITAYNKADIENMGYYTLSDLASITAGYSSYSIYGEKVFETRGQKAGSFNNNKHLLLIDGIPVNHARAYKANTEEELPLFFAEKVELLRGPASSLYGVSAFFGVINIFSPELYEIGTKAETKFRAGTYDSNRQVMSNITYKSDIGEVKLNIGYFEKNASKDFVGVSNSQNNLYMDDRKATFINSSYKLNKSVLKGASLGFIYMNKTGGLGEHWMHGSFSHEINDLSWTTFIAYIKYEKEISDNLKLNSYFKYNQSTEQGWWAPFNSTSYLSYNGNGTILKSYNIPVNNFEGQIEAGWKNNISDIIFGVNIDSRYQLGDAKGAFSYDVLADSGEVYMHIPVAQSIKFNTYSVYLQAQKRLKLLEGLLLTAGIRNDYGQAEGNVYNQLSPRVAVVQKITNTLNLKLLYGTALRAPGIKEVTLNNEAKINSPGIVLPDLLAEKISSFEAGISLQNKNILTSVNYFTNSTLNALNGTRVDNENVFINSDGVTKSSGVEFEINYVNSLGFRMFANYAYALALINDTLELYDIPTQKANAGIVYSSKSKFKFSIATIGHWVDTYRVADPQMSEAAGHTTIDINFILSVNKNIGLEFQVRNVFDQDYKLPKLGVPDVPMPGRYFNFSLSMKI